MTSADPPSKIPPKGLDGKMQPGDDFEGKKKIGKVEGVDADEARKQKFRKYYGEDKTEKAFEKTEESSSRPSPMDLARGKKNQGTGGETAFQETVDGTKERANMSRIDDPFDKSRPKGPSGTPESTPGQIPGKPTDKTGAPIPHEGRPGYKPTYKGEEPDAAHGSIPGRHDHKGADGQIPGRPTHRGDGTVPGKHGHKEMDGQIPGRHHGHKETDSQIPGRPMNHSEGPARPGRHDHKGTDGQIPGRHHGHKETDSHIPGRPMNHSEGPARPSRHDKHHEQVPGQPQPRKPGHHETQRHGQAHPAIPEHPHSRPSVGKSEKGRAKDHGHAMPHTPHHGTAAPRPHARSEGRKVERQGAQEETPIGEEAAASGLPRAEEFWEGVDFPPNQPPGPKDLEEKAKKGSSFEPVGKKQEEFSPFDLPRMAREKEMQRMGKKDPLAPMKEEMQLARDLGMKPEERKRLEEGSPAVPFAGQAQGNHFAAGKVGEPRAIDAQGSSMFPPSVQPIAVAAVREALPYLSPATEQLFFQMVGTIVIMTAPPGISRTEISLNSPAFANSKFFGATITLERYSTAPDSFNIRLTGTEQAVSLFKDNAASLMSAFQNGNFNFKVNRLDAEYTMERPTFRRREEGDRGGGDAGGGDMGERRR